MVYIYWNVIEFVHWFYLELVGRYIQGIYNTTTLEKMIWNVLLMWIMGLEKLDYSTIHDFNNELLGIKIFSYKIIGGYEKVFFYDLFFI